MQRLEFETCVNPDGTLTIPAEISAKLAKNQPVKVFVIAPDSDDDKDWLEFAAEAFLRGYADCDSIYDDDKGASHTRHEVAFFER